MESRATWDQLSMSPKYQCRLVVITNEQPFRWQISTTMKPSSGCHGYESTVQRLTGQTTRLLSTANDIPQGVSRSPLWYTRYLRLKPWKKIYIYDMRRFNARMKPQFESRDSRR